MKLICIGDSLTYGYGVRSYQRWTYVTSHKTGWDIINEGISGDTTGGMLSRMQIKVLPDLRKCSPCEDRPHVMLMGGGNDVFYSGTDSGARANMGAMIHQLLSAGVHPMVGIPLPVDVSQAPKSWSSVVDFFAAEKTMYAYRNWLRGYCTAFGVPYVDFCADFLSSDGVIYSGLLLDGLHPTPDGHQLMAHRLSQQLEGELFMPE